MPDVGATQRDSQKFIAFTNWQKMNTRLSRTALPENQLAWLENLQPLGENNLVPVPAANPVLNDLPSGYTTKTIFFANIGSVDYAIIFTTNGAAIAMNLVTGSGPFIAPSGTFTNPDLTTYASQRVLIADPTAGYCTWDGTAFVASGGLSPNISVTNGGTTAYTSAPTVGFTGGSGTGATATAVLDGSGFVVKVNLTNGGHGYKPGDTVTVTFTGGGGAGAAATARVWPNMGLQTTPTTQGASTIAVFAGRVWVGNGRVLTFTGTAGYDDISATNAAGSVTFADADLSHTITALRTLNNYLFIFGDQSVRQIGSILIGSGNITLFTPFVLASDIGTNFKQTILSYNRLVLFANKNGIYAIFGASVEKISDDLDGIFAGPSKGGTTHSHIDFSLPPQAALVDLRNVHCYLLLVRYVDPVAGPRSLILAFQDKQWFFISQGALVSIVPTFLASTQQWEVFGSSGIDITLLLQDTTTAVPVKLVTALSPHQNPIQAKQALRAGVAAVTNSQQTLTLLIESEYTTRTYNQLVLPYYIIWVNYQNMVVTWTNSTGGVVNWAGPGGFRFPFTAVDGLGKFLGMTLTATLVDSVINMLAIEYQDRALWGRPA